MEPVISSNYQIERFKNLDAMATRREVGQVIERQVPPVPPALPTKDKIEVLWPREMKKDSSSVITIVLADKNGGPLLPPSDYHVVVGQRTASAKLNSVTINRLNEKYAGYEIYARAVLTANNFNIASGSLEWQNLNQSEIKWEWSIAPRNERPLETDQRLSAAIEVEYREKDGKVISKEQLWQDSFGINVYSHWLTKDPPNITSLLGMVVGAGVTVPWTYERIQKRRRRKKKKAKLSGKPSNKSSKKPNAQDSKSGAQKPKTQATTRKNG